MQVHFGLESLRADWQRAVVCIGTFDGVHLGHQAVIRAAVEEAACQELPSVLLTFDKHPAAILNPKNCPPSVGTLRSNLEAFQELGVSVAVVLAFTKEFSQTPAETFFNETLVEHLRAGEVVVGYDFAFGHKRQGTPEWLCERIKTKIIQAFMLEGKRVSSTEIRKCIQEGRVEEATKLLGRPFELDGDVVHGDKKGIQLGFPTINLARTSDQVVPADGVYACRCETPFGTFAAAGSVGMRPTFSGKARTIEAYLIDYPGGNLYGKAVSLAFLAKVRDQEMFQSENALKEQMSEDVELVRKIARP